MTELDHDYLVNLLQLSQSGDNVATDCLIENIRDQIMGKRIGRYLHKNRQAEDDDLKQEFMIGCALAIPRASMDIGDPIEYIVAQGVFRVRSYLRSRILTSTSQICLDCGNESRLHKIDGRYTCKKCGSHNIETREVYDHDDTVFDVIADTNDEIDQMIEVMGSNTIVEQFRSTLDPNTKVASLFKLMYDDDINSSNPFIKNYIAEIAKVWNTSQTVVVQNKEKLKDRITKFCVKNGYIIKDNHFVEEVEEYGRR